MDWGANNLTLIAIIVLTFGVFAAMMWKDTVLDFIKANLGLFILLLLFLVLLGISFHVFHEANANTLGKDFLAWLEQKAGEVLASIMTLVVSAKTANNRASDRNGNGSDTTSSSSTTSTSTKSSSTGIGSSAVLGPLGTPNRAGSGVADH